MSCENKERNNEERYKKDFKKAILLKFKHSTAPNSETWAESDRELSELQSRMSAYSGKPSKTIAQEVNQSFLEEWERETKDMFRRKESLYRYRQKKNMEVQMLLQYMDK